MRIVRTTAYDKWFDGLADLAARSKVNARLRRIQLHGQLLGDMKRLSREMTELRPDTGPGYRIYLTMRRQLLIILLGGGDKSTQSADIARATQLARQLENPS